MGMAFEVLCLTVMAVSPPNFLFRPQEVELWEQHVPLWKRFHVKRSILVTRPSDDRPRGIFLHTHTQKQGRGKAIRQMSKKSDYREKCLYASMWNCTN